MGGDGRKSGRFSTGCFGTIGLAAMLLGAALFLAPSKQPVTAAPLGLASQTSAPAVAAAPAVASNPQNTDPTGLFPALTGRVVDNANIIPDDTEAQITQKLAALETQSQRQLVVVTLPSLQGYDIADYGYQLGRKWGIGDKTRNDGALLIIAPNDRKLRIEVGYGLEPVLTDGLSSLIINQTIVPYFKSGDMPSGIMAGTDALIHQLQLPAEEAQKIAAEANQSQSSDGIDAGTVIFLILFFLFFVLPLIRRMRGGSRYNSGIGPVIIWGGGGDSDWGGGGGFGGGGFGGGGGSFGGGGSSGSW